MSDMIDLRDFERGTKRTAKDFRRVLRKALDGTAIENSKVFDRAFHSDISAITSHLAFAYQAVNAIGLRRSERKPPEKEQAFFLLHESLNLVVVALRALRNCNKINVPHLGVVGIQYPRHGG